MSSTKTPINFMADSSLKKDFYKVVREMNITPSSAFNMLMKKVVITRSIGISLPKEDNSEIENIDISDWDEDIKEEIGILNKKSEILFSNLREQGKL